MSRTDELIERALSAEDRELLARHGEPGYLSQAFGLFRGPLGWVVWLGYVTGVVAFLGFALAFWKMWAAVAVLDAVRWGMLGVVLFQYAAMMKAFLGSHLEANRTLRELKRIEVQLSLARDVAVRDGT